MLQSPRILTLTLSLLLAGCSSVGVILPQGTQAHGDPAHAVPASAETSISHKGLVDADDPALWVDPRDSSRAVLFGTDKTHGLYVHNIDGTMRQFLPDGPLNNVDLRSDFQKDGRSYVLIAASERNRFGIMTYLFDPDSFETKPYGFLPTSKEFGEPYGFCMAQIGADFAFIANNKEGQIEVYRLANGAPLASAQLLHSFKLNSQLEGCVSDDETGLLYVGEEDHGIWRFDLNNPTRAPHPVALADGIRLTADVEGLTVFRDGPHRYLIASSQGDATYPVWRIEGDQYHYVGRFAVEGGSIDNVTGTDGLDSWSGPIGPYPEGAIAMHDTDDGNRQQNYKIVDWRAVKQALKLP